MTGTTPLSECPHETDSGLSHLHGHLCPHTVHLHDLPLLPLLPASFIPRFHPLRNPEPHRVIPRMICLQLPSGKGRFLVTRGNCRCRQTLDAGTVLGPERYPPRFPLVSPLLCSGRTLTVCSPWPPRSEADGSIDDGADTGTAVAAAGSSSPTTSTNTSSNNNNSNSNKIELLLWLWYVCIVALALAYTMLSLGPVIFHGEEPPAAPPGFTASLFDPNDGPAPPPPSSPTAHAASSCPSVLEEDIPAPGPSSSTDIASIDLAPRSKPPSSKASKKAARKARKVAKDAAAADDHKLKATADEDGDLPFPAAVGSDGKHEVGYLPPLENMKRPILEAWCKEFKLSVGGKKAQLIEQLKNFSADRTAWDSLLPGAQNAHKGPRTGTKTSAKKSTNRRNALLGMLAPEDGKTVVLHQLPTERSKDTRTLDEIEYGVTWATNVASFLPYRPPGTADDESTPPFRGEDVPAPSPNNGQTAEMIRLQEQLQQTQLQLIDALARLSCMPPPAPLPTAPVASFSMPAGSHSTPMQPPPPAALQPRLPPPALVPDPVHLPSTFMAAAAATSTPAPLISINTTKKAMANVKELVLGNGVKITFSPEDVPALPALSFVNALGRLNSIWDDTSIYWNKDNPDTPLIIKGQPIALIYWPAVFTYSKNKKWEVIKKQFVDWREFVLRYRKGTPEEFWKEFSSKDGKYLSWTTITELLREERKAEYAATVKQAHEQYGSSFEQVFSYSKKGKTVVMSRPCTIHEHYLKLHSSSASA